MRWSAVLSPGVVYIIDRNFIHFGLLNTLIEADSGFVIRLKKNNLFDVDVELPLTAATAKKA